MLSWETDRPSPPTSPRHRGARCRRRSPIWRGYAWPIGSALRSAPPTSPPAALSARSRPHGIARDPPRSCSAAPQPGASTASFGTMATPFHAGKAAMDGVVAAQLAAAGFTAATGLFEPGGGLDTALVQDRSVTFASLDSPGDLSGWRILDNSFKPYAACHLTHPAVDAARALAPLLADHGGAGSIRAELGALAQQITGGKRGEPASPLEGKFDLKYCVALGFHGHAVSAADFR